MSEMTELGSTSAPSTLSTDSGWKGWQAAEMLRWLGAGPARPKAVSATSRS